MVTGLLAGLRDRGLDVTRPIQVVIDGAKALKTAVKAVFDRAEPAVQPDDAEVTWTDSPVVADIDYDAPGMHYGLLRIPRSTNDSGWSSLIVPIVVVVHGTGPTALILGGNHGDEPVGIFAALDLARRVQVEEVNGRLIVIPCLSLEAAMANTRLWPSRANFNRSFPVRQPVRLTSSWPTT